MQCLDQIVLAYRLHQANRRRRDHVPLAGILMGVAGNENYRQARLLTAQMRDQTLSLNRPRHDDVGNQQIEWPVLFEAPERLRT